MGVAVDLDSIGWSFIGVALQAKFIIANKYMGIYSNRFRKCDHQYWRIMQEDLLVLYVMIIITNCAFIKQLQLVMISTGFMKIIVFVQVAVQNLRSGNK